MSELIHIDGSKGEGGGQVLRTALGLSIVTDTVAIYGGRIAMENSEMGGLKVVLNLPAAASEGASRRRDKRRS